MNNKKIIERYTSGKNCFGTAEPENTKMASRFQTLKEEQIAKLLNEKDSNTQKATKGSHLIFEAHLQEKNIRAEELAIVLQNSMPR